MNTSILARRTASAAVLMVLIQAFATAQAQPPAAGSRPLTATGLDNVAAFAHLVGVVRHFYPSEEVRTTNWDDFMIRAVRVVEPAKSPAELAKTLTTLFATVAPEIAVYPTDRPPPPAPPIHRDSIHRAVAYWSNTGITLAAPEPGKPTAYGSVLTTAVPPDEIPSDEPRNPSNTWKAALSGGVSAVVPVSRWVQVPSAGFMQEPVAPTPPTEPASPRDRATRFAGVIEVWNIYQHSYPYFDRVQLDWPAELRRALASAATDTSPRDYQATLQRLVAATHDGHGYVAVKPPYVKAHLPIGLGWVENTLVITQVGAAAPSALHQGDVVEAINGIRADSVLARCESITSASTPWARRALATGSCIAFADSGTPATLRMANGSDVSLTYNVSAALAAPRPARVAEVAPGIVYIDISRLTAADNATLLPQIQAARGIVVDMRAYPSSQDGFTSIYRILQHLTTDTLRSFDEMATFVRPDEEGADWYRLKSGTPPLAPRLTAKMAFITGAGTYSAGETLMGMVEDFHLGEIVGEPTAGIDGNTNVLQIVGGYEIAVTGMRVLKLDGSPLFGVGILPTAPVSRTLQGVTAGRDEALERAIAIVSGTAP